MNLLRPSVGPAGLAWDLSGRARTLLGQTWALPGLVLGSLRPGMDHYRLSMVPGMARAPSGGVGPLGL